MGPRERPCVPGRKLGGQNLEVHLPRRPLCRSAPRTPGPRRCPGAGHPPTACRAEARPEPAPRAGQERPAPGAARTPVPSGRLGHSGTCPPGGLHSALGAPGPASHQHLSPGPGHVSGSCVPLPDRPPARLQKLGARSGLKEGPALSFIRKPGNVSEDTSLKTQLCQCCWETH